MATARIVTPEPVTPPSIIELSLTQKEAESIFALLGCVRGKGEEREAIGTIYRSMFSLGLKHYLNHSGMVTFQ